MDESTHHQIEQLADFLRPSQKTVVFTGMGISVPSYPPDFLEKMTAKAWAPITYDEFVQSPERRRESWRRHFFSAAELADAKPNKGHMALADLVALGKVSCVITQNVDNFHQQSGIPDERIIELHGNSTYAACLDCRQRYEMSEVKAIFESDETLPVCNACGGILKPSVVSFGQSMPDEPIQLAKQEALACGLCLVLGSSLVVQPSSTIPRVAKENGASLVMVNSGPTEMDDSCDLVLHAPIDVTLAGVIAHL